MYGSSWPRLRLTGGGVAGVPWSFPSLTTSGTNSLARPVTPPLRGLTHKAPAALGHQIIVSRRRGRMAAGPLFRAGWQG